MRVVWSAVRLLALAGWQVPVALEPPCPAGTERRQEYVGDGYATACWTPAGLKEGPHRIVHVNGTLVADGHFEANRPSGWWTNWYSNGQKQDEGAYRAGQRWGWWTRWHPNGQKHEEGEYRDGYEKGFWRAWDENGRLISAVPRDVECPAPLEWHDEIPLLDVFSHTHALPTDGRQCRRRDRVRQGPSVSWFFGRRKLAHLGSYCDGQAQGRWSFFWPNGVIAREGAFTGASLKHGTWTDWDDKGRTLRETTYVDGKEVGTREFPLDAPGPGSDPAVLDAAAVARYEAVVRQACSAQPRPIRPFEGLRSELNAADAVLRVRRLAVQTGDRPPGWRGDLDPPLPEYVGVAVKKVLAGRVASEGDELQLFVDADQQARRAKAQGRFLRGSLRDETTAVVRREGDRLVVLSLFDANDTERTDEFFAAYAALARLEDAAFTAGLGRLLADRVLLAPQRLLWVNWALLAFDDWDRLHVPLPIGDAALRRLLRDTHRAVLLQIEATLRGQGDGVNLWELPWLIRLLPNEERRQMAAVLLRMHALMAKQEREAARAVAPTTHREGDPTAELTMEQIRAMWAAGDMNALMRCLAACVDPHAPVEYPHEKVLRRARAFAR